MKHIFLGTMLLTSLLAAQIPVNAQTNITNAEYFFDTDPGYGNATTVTLTPASNLVSQAVNANVTSLQGGMHTLFIRTKDANGKWSTTNFLSIAKVQLPFNNPTGMSNIDKVEYFYDVDPGYGNGTDIPVTSALTISNFVINTNVNALANGMHTLFIRSRNVNGLWSTVNGIVFAKMQMPFGNPQTAGNIDKMEYYYDTDPGYGNGVDIPVTPSANMNSLVVNPDVSTITAGLHTLYMRTRDAQGKWAITNTLPFAKIQLPYTNPHTVSNITKAEYFYDTDPGFGNGTNIPITSGTNIVALNFNANVSAIPNGAHTLYVRSMDAQGKWSEPNYISFAKVQVPFSNPHTLSNITSIEYFLDTDPGFGSGTAVAVTPNQTLTNISFNVDLTYVVNGPHTVYVRTKDAQGKWSITNYHSFNGGAIPLAIKLLSFEAKLQQSGKVLLEWITEAETNVAKYTVEKSYDAASWTSVGNKLPVTATSTEHRTYQMPDENPGEGIIYYRLTEYALDNTKTVAPIRFVRITGESIADANVYPNPNDGKIVNIKSDIFEDGEIVISIISIDGKLYLRQPVSNINNNIFTLSDLDLPPSVYSINLQSKTRSQSLKLNVIGNGL